MSFRPPIVNSEEPDRVCSVNVCRSSRVRRSENVNKSAFTTSDDLSGLGSCSRVSVPKLSKRVPCCVQVVELSGDGVESDGE